MRRRDLLKGAAGASVSATLGLAPSIRSARAQARDDTLLSVSESGPNALDFHAVGANRSVMAVVWNTYDRLISFGVKRDANGDGYYDYKDIQPELAEDWDLKPDSMTLKLRKDAKFHDGTPVTAKDVKWTFDRAIGVGAYPASNLASASLTKPEQFVVVDEHTVRVDFLVRDKLGPLFMGVPTLGIYNSELVKSHVTPQDPWGQNWTKNNIAGGGAFRLEHWTPGQDISFVANSDWKSGLPPKIKRVVWRTIPSGGTRRALLERGDVDLSYDVAPRDAADFISNRDLRVYGVPMENTVEYLGMNVKAKPYDSLNVRRAIAYALPYEDIMRVALFNRARGLFGGADRVGAPEWPQSHGYRTDLAKARQLLAEAGYPDGFETTLSFDLGSAGTLEPIGALIQESLEKVGIRAQLDKIPGANWRAAFGKKNLAMQVNVFGCWFNYSDFFFHMVYSTDNTIFNTMAYQNPGIDKLINDARYSSDSQSYDNDAKAYIQTAFDDVPNIPLYQPYLDIAMRKNVHGCIYWFHREMDYRSLSKA